VTALCDRSATELGAMLRAGETSSVEITAACSERIEAVDDRVRAFLARRDDAARDQAAAADSQIASGDARAVTGIPLALKDVLSTRGVETTCGSKILDDYVPPYDCTPWKRLKDDNSVLLGKTNCDEFAMGSSNENSAFGPVHNPWDLAMVPGGSSGGSAAAVAAGEAIWALGTDTGGSVRQPASLCGVVGLKPTYGLISRYGLIAFASSLDTIGTFTRGVRDAALLLSCIGGKDVMDATSLDTPRRDYTEGIDGGIDGLRVGVVREAFGEGVEAGVESSVRDAVDRLAGLGATVGETSLPHTDYALSAYYLIAPSECSSNLARFDAMRYGLRAGDDGTHSAEEVTALTRGAGFGDEVKRRVMLGTYALSAGYYDAYYVKAQQVRTLIKAEFDDVLTTVDAILAPTSPTVAFKIGAKVDDPLAMYLNDACTLPVNIAGLPGISVPCGLSDGLPVGLQVIGRAFDEATVLRVADAYERAAGFADVRPPIAHD
jgi:aspartyl-tRNA(Asn)/glutamyl-tRNA(Gln) amidotransferase subunit A